MHFEETDLHQFISIKFEDTEMHCREELKGNKNSRGKPARRKLEEVNKMCQKSRYSGNLFTQIYGSYSYESLPFIFLAYI